MARRKSVARRNSEIRKISEKISQNKNLINNAARGVLIVLHNHSPQIMESVASKLRSGKTLADALKLKDASKRHGESLPDGGGKKRILGDITNRVPATRGKSDLNLSTKVKVEPKKDSKVSENVKKSNSTMYDTAIEMDDSDIYESFKEEDTENAVRSRPEGVEDFDSTCNDDPSSVPQYAGDIFRWYREREKQFTITKYLENQKEMTKQMRAILVDWMVEVQESFELNHETLYLAVKLVDIYLAKNFVAKSKLQLVGATAVFIAAKFDERLPPLIDDFLYICDDSYNRPEFLETEIKILKTINFDLGIPLSYRFLRRYARCAKISMEMLTLARFILETSLMDYELIDVLDSKIAAAALLLALKMKDMEWTPTLEYYTEYKESELQDLIVLLNKNIAAAPNKNCQTIRTKYSHEIFFHVAKIPPLRLSKNGQLEKAIKLEKAQ